MTATSAATPTRKPRIGVAIQAARSCVFPVIVSSSRHTRPRPESGINDVVLVGAGVFFLLTLETRIKRRRALTAIRELRAIAHIIDMHQLTKDPEPILRTGPPTAHSPKRSMTPFELSRYFDYCSETLAIVSKVGALYVQAFPDTVALDAVDDLEDLCAGLSRKIWQKIMVLDRFAGGAA